MHNFQKQIQYKPTISFTEKSVGYINISKPKGYISTINETTVRFTAAAKLLTFNCVLYSLY